MKSSGIASGKFFAFLSGIILFLLLLSIPVFGHYADPGEYKNAPEIHSFSASGDFNSVKSLVRHTPSLVNLRAADGVTPLHLAAKFGHTEIMEFLISKGAALDAKTDDDSTPLHFASDSGQFRAAVILIREGADVNAVTKNRMTPLHYSSYGGWKELTGYLIDKGANMYAANDCGVLPIEMACSKPDIFKLILSKGYDVNHRSKDKGIQIIHKAAGEASEEVVRLLLERGADPNAPGNMGQTPLFEAVKGERIDNVKLLTRAGAEINLVTSAGSPFEESAAKGSSVIFRYLTDMGGDFQQKVGGSSLLHYAALGGSREIINLCISKGLDPNRKDVRGRTPLHMAAGSGSPQTVKLFLKLGADVNAKDNDDNTPLHYAMTDSPKAYDVVKLLIDAGADKDAENNLGETPLLLVRQWNKERYRMLELLTSKGADLSKRDRTGKTVYIKMVEAGDLDALKFLISRDTHSNPERDAELMEAACLNASTDIVRYMHAKGCNINRCRKGCSPIHFASRKKGPKTDTIRYLLDNGADCTCRDCNGETPLILNAMASSSPDVFKMLLERGAEINETDNQGNTALHYLAEGEEPDSLKLLLSKGANPNIKNSQGKTPLQTALENDKMENARILISNWADVSPAAFADMSKDTDKRTFNYVLRHSQSLWIKFILPVLLLTAIILIRTFSRKKDVQRQ